jgi:hypothetical protein
MQHDRCVCLCVYARARLCGAGVRGAGPARRAVAHASTAEYSTTPSSTTHTVAYLQPGYSAHALGCRVLAGTAGYCRVLPGTVRTHSYRAPHGRPERRGHCGHAAATATSFVRLCACLLACVFVAAPLVVPRAHERDRRGERVAQRTLVGGRRSGKQNNRRCPLPSDSVAPPEHRLKANKQTSGLGNGRTGRARPSEGSRRRRRRRRRRARARARARAPRPPRGARARAAADSAARTDRYFRITATVTSDDADRYCG